MIQPQTRQITYEFSAETFWDVLFIGLLPSVRYSTSCPADWFGGGSESPW